jgi:ectoine hydroxylase-related dioxygenase (phytanoyl-CoA dioxygenase family)
VNDTDGDTIIFDEKYDASELELLNPKRVPPRKGKAVFFNGEHYHASCNPIKSKKRVVINYDVVVS